MQTRAMKRLAAATLSLSLLAAACGEDDEPIVTAEPSSEVPSDEMDMEEMDMEEMDETEHEHEHDEETPVDGEEHETHDEHDHTEIVEANAEAIPTLDVAVSSDPAGGVNIALTTNNFTSAPEAASGEHVDGEGHFHLFIDGERVLRFYNDTIYYAGVVEGDVEVSVALATNDHRSYAVNGEAIVATVDFAVPAHGHDEHSHDDPEPVAFEGEAPTLALSVEADAKSGWNAFVEIDGFVLSPENVSAEHVAGEGHLHINVNGQKIGRLYGDAMYIGVLPEGPVEVSVVAYTNDHQLYTVDGQPISAAVQLEVPA